MKPIRPITRLAAIAGIPRVQNAILLATGAAAVIAACLGATRFVHEAPNVATAEPDTGRTASDDSIAQAAAASDTADPPRPRSHVGFDTNVYPGDRAMDAWKRSGQYEWVGYYLSAPCHSDDSWSGKRAQLVNNGWGLAVIYVGQQTWGRSYARTKRIRVTKKKNGHKTHAYRMKRLTRIPVATNDDARCGVKFVNAAQGKIDAMDAIDEARKEGFPDGTIIFLDVEFMNTVPQRMRDYYRAWTRQVLTDGRYKPGYYVHTNNASTIYDDVVEEYDRAGNWREPAFWISGKGGFADYRAPTDVGHKFATAWQGLLDVVREHNGVKLPVDISVASVASPSTR